MTEMLYLEDSYLKEFEAAVKSVSEGKFVVLERENLVSVFSKRL